MKTTVFFQLKLMMLPIALCSCNKYETATAKAVNQAETPGKIELAKEQNQNKEMVPTGTTTQQTAIFTGSFATNFNGSEVYVDLTENQNQVKGTFTLNHETFQLSAMRQDSTFSGKISEAATGRFYTVTAEMKEKLLHLFIPFPELNNQVVELQLSKTAKRVSAKSFSDSIERNPLLIGTWRCTEVLSSGYGSSYGSMATDYFVQFKSNGECVSWTGSSAGGSNAGSFESSGGKNISVEEWHTEGKNLVVVNPKTRQKSSVPFYAEESRMILKGKKSRVYQRVR